jgi:large subunit ribosomal protein L17
MRHRIGQRKLGRVTDHRIAMLRNQAEALIRHEHIETTLPKAKELRPFVERIITIAKRGLAGDATLNARRLVLRDIQNRDVVGKLFDTIAPRFAARPGGYTRILRVGYRRGDSAEVAQIELVGSEYDPNAEAARPETAAHKPKGVGGRLRAAADRLRGKAKADGEDGEAAEGAAPKKKAKPERTYDGKGGKADTRGKGAKTSTPRKAGGS